MDNFNYLCKGKNHIGKCTTETIYIIPSVREKMNTLKYFKSKGYKVFNTGLYIKHLKNYHVHVVAVFVKTNPHTEKIVMCGIKK